MEEALTPPDSGDESEEIVITGLSKRKKSSTTTPRKTEDWWKKPVEVITIEDSPENERKTSPKEVVSLEDTSENLKKKKKKKKKKQKTKKKNKNEKEKAEEWIEKGQSEEESGASDAAWTESADRSEDEDQAELRNRMERPWDPWDLSDFIPPGSKGSRRNIRVERSVVSVSLLQNAELFKLSNKIVQRFWDKLRTVDANVKKRKFYKRIMKATYDTVIEDSEIEAWEEDWNSDSEEEEEDYYPPSDEESDSEDRTVPLNVHTYRSLRTKSGKEELPVVPKQRKKREIVSLTSQRKKARSELKTRPATKQLKFPGIGWNNLIKRGDQEMELLGSYITYEVYVKVRKSVEVFEQPLMVENKINKDFKLTNVRMRLLSFEQLFFWYYVIQNGKGSFLEVVLDTDQLAGFMSYYYGACDESIEEKYQKKTGASTVANHFEHFATFYKWFMSLKGYEEEKPKAIQAYFYCTLEAKTWKTFITWDRRSNVSESTQRERQLWVDADQLGELMKDLLIKLMEIEDNWDCLDKKKQFKQFILHEKVLMASQLIEWHGVRREIISMQTIHNVKLGEYFTRGPDREDGSVRVGYKYRPPVEKSNMRPTRSLIISEDLCFAYGWHLEKRQLYVSDEVVQSTWINERRGPLSASSVTSYIKDAYFAMCEKYMGPIDIRRIFISQVLLDEALGNVKPKEVDNFLQVLNTTSDIAHKYYCIRDFYEVAVRVRDNFRAEDSFYATPELNATRKVAEKRSQFLVEERRRREFEEERLRLQDAQAIKKKAEAEKKLREEREALIREREMMRIPRRTVDKESEEAVGRLERAISENVHTTIKRLEMSHRPDSRRRR